MVEKENYNKSLLRALSVLNCFSPQETELSAADLIRKNGLSKATINRLLVTLTQARLLEKTEKAGKYKIGPHLYVLGNLYLSDTDVLKAAEPTIKVLNEITREAISVGILSDGNLIIIMKEESKQAFRYAAHIGTSLPAYASAMGKALLSELDEKKIDELYPVENLKPVASKTISTKTELKRDLGEIRATGISLNVEGAYEGVAGVATVIRGSNGKALAAMVISVQVYRINDTLREKFKEVMKLGASLVSYRLGYQDIRNPVRDIGEITSWWAKNKDDVVEEQNEK